MKTFIPLFLGLSFMAACSSSHGGHGLDALSEQLKNNDISIGYDGNDIDDTKLTDSEQNGCKVPQSAFGNVFSIDPTGPNTQIHAAAAFDGKGIWVVYNRPAKGSTKFSVWAVRLHCDGTQAVKPFQVSHDSTDNNVDPSITITSGSVMFAWPADNGGSNPNMSIWYRTYRIDGTDLMSRDKQLDLTNTPAQGFNAWMVQSAALGDNFAVTCAVGTPNYKGFQVLMGVLDSTGTIKTPFRLASPQKGQSQVWPVIASDSKGRTYLAWEDDAGDNKQVQVLLPGAKSPIDPYPGHPSASPSYGSAVGTNGPWLAFQSSENAATRIIISNGVTPVGHHAVIDNGSGMNHTPIVKAVPGGGVVVWYRVITGIKNEVWYQEFSDDHGTPKVTGRPIQVNHNPAAPYPPALAVLPNGYFIAWSEGKSPDFRINGVFLHKSLK